MVHAYHAIFGAYGFWLPNDLRGSWSDFVGAWELVRFGRATKSLERFELTEQQKREQQLAKESLKYTPVQFSGTQARSIAHGFASTVQRSGLTIWACSILPEHVHLVIARHRLKVETIVTMLKGEASKQLRLDHLHPFASHVRPNGQLPSPWAGRKWKVFLDSEEAIRAAIRYVELNPIKEGMPPQRWSFVTPFLGLDEGCVSYH